MKTLSELKSAALQSLKGKWGLCVIATFVVWLLGAFAGNLFPFTFQISLNPIISSIGGLEMRFLIFSILFIVLIIGAFLMFSYQFLVALPLSYFYSVSFLKFVREGDNNILSHMFDDSCNYKRALFVSFMVYIYTFLWGLLFIIPGIIKSYSYSMTYFISKDHPEYTVDKCIEESRRIMKGNKWRLFVLHLSFIGWAILCVLTLGIGFLWLTPYIQTTTIHFYEEIKNGNQPQQIEEVAGN